VFLVQDDIAIAVKLIDAQFPPYEQVIPKEHKKLITVDRMRLIDALRRTMCQWTLQSHHASRAILDSSDCEESDDPGPGRGDTASRRARARSWATD
jgi:hypothetical protein